MLERHDTLNMSGQWDVQTCLQKQGGRVLRFDVYTLPHLKGVRVEDLFRASMRSRQTSDRLLFNYEAKGSKHEKCESVLVGGTMTREHILNPMRTSNTGRG